MDTSSDEHPIIFNDWSVRRILAGEKTQTRRVVKPQPNEGVEAIHEQDGSWFAGTINSEWDPVLWEEKCPYGQPGDVLWVRETFRLDSVADDLSPAQVLECHKDNDMPFDLPFTEYEADGEVRLGGSCVQEPSFGRKRSSIHMPRELCRLRLRVEDVRVEQVQEISYEDVVAEGLESHVDRERYGQKRTVKYPWSLIERDDLPDTGHSVQDYDYAFKKLWNDIHGDGAWERNDWVWVVAFSRIDN
jgi:hypothetical protein